MCISGHGRLGGLFQAGCRSVPGSAIIGTLDLRAIADANRGAIQVCAETLAGSEHLVGIGLTPADDRQAALHDGYADGEMRASLHESDRNRRWIDHETVSNASRAWLSSVSSESQP